MSTTLNDIAEQLNVAKSTVSLVLRDHPISKKFNEPLRKRIKQTAEQMNYRPNFFASGLSGKQSKLLMLCLSHLQDHWASTIASAFEHEAALRGYRVLISAFHDKEDPLAFNRDLLGSQGVNAMAVVGSSEDKFTDSAIGELADEGVKIALVGRQMDDSRIAQVLADNDDGVHQVAEHLYGQDLESVWVLTIQSKGTIAQRAATFKAISQKMGKPAPRLLQIEGKSFISASYQKVSEALDQYPPPQALFACGDILALGAMRAFQERNITPGKDVAIVGFDGGVFSEASTPTLTTVVQPMAQMGRQAARALIEITENPNARPEKIVLPVELAIGESSVIRKPCSTPHKNRASVGQGSPCQKNKTTNDNGINMTKPPDRFLTGAAR